MDINALINQHIANVVASAVQTATADLRFSLLRMQQQLDAERQRATHWEGRAKGLEDRVNELAADLGRWKGKQLEIPTGAINTLHARIDEVAEDLGAHRAAIQSEVERVEKRVDRVSTAIQDEDSQFTQNVRQIAREVYDELQEADNDDDADDSSNQDNENARIRDLVRDVLQDEDFTDSLLSDDFLSKRVVELFHQGPLTISVDRV